MLDATVLCSGSICGALHYTLESLAQGGGGEEQQLKQARKKYPQLINALVSFALSHRTPNEFRNMKSVLEDCRCTPPSTGLSLAQINTLHNHMFGRASPTAKLPGLAGVVFTYLKTLIWQLHTASLETYGQKAAQGRGDRGLQRMAYFLVEDVDGTVDACIQWFEKTEDPQVFDFLTLCLERFEPRFFPALLKRSADILRPLTDVLGDIVGTTTASSSLYVKTKYNGRSLSYEEIGREVVRLTNLAFFMSKSITIRCGRYTGELKIFFGPEATRLDDILARIIAMEPSSSSLRNNFTMFRLLQFSVRSALDNGTAELELGGMKASSGNGKISLSYGGLRPNENPDKFPYLTAYSVLFQLAAKYNRRCSNPECLRLAKPDEKPFSRCSRCSVTVYCSPACHKHGWNLLPSPHKHFCTLTKELKDAWAPFAPGSTRISPEESVLKATTAEAGVQVIDMDLWALTDHFKSLFGGSQLGGKRKKVDYQEGNDAMGFLGNLLSQGMVERVERGSD